MMDRELAFEEWLDTVPGKLQADPLWKAVYYRRARNLYDLVWRDCELLRKDFRGREIVHQIVRRAGSVCANIEEAYGRGVGSADLIHITHIALGEARETQGWYFRSRHILLVEILNHWLIVINQIITMLAPKFLAAAETYRVHSLTSSS